jgi:hypothetical protein
MMTRNLKILFAAVMALMALAPVASSAQAADEFHCSVEPCRITLLTDGTGKTTHQVFIVESKTTTEAVSFTCESIRGEGVAPSKTATAGALTVSFDNCNVNGTPGVIVHMNGCEYTLTAAGGTTDQANAHLLCPVGKQVEVRVPPGGGCIFFFGAQTPGNGVGYKNEGVTPNRVVTVTGNVHGIVVTASAGCAGLINPNQTLEGTYTTGNTLVTGETEAGVMADAWYE